MAFILDTEINSNQPLFLALQKIYGLGNSQSAVIMKKLGFSHKLNISELPEEKINDLTELLKNSKSLLSNELKTYLNIQLNYKVSIKSYKGLRRISGFPIRGQRTRTNAKTSKILKAKV